MKNNDVIQLILSLRNEFAAINYSDDSQNNSTSHFFEKIQNSGQSLNEDEKIVYHVFRDTFVVDYYNTSLGIRDSTNTDSQDLSEIEIWSQLSFKNFISEGFRKNDTKKEELKKISLNKYSELFRRYDKNTAYYNTLMDWYLIKKINFLSDADFFNKNELEKNETEINAIYDELININNGNPKLYFMHRKILYLCSLDDSPDQSEQLQTLLKSDVEGDYKVLIIRDLMTRYTNDQKNKEALAIADQAKKQFPDSIFLTEIQYKEDVITSPVLRLNFEAQAQSKKPIHIVAEHRNVSDFVLSIYEVHDGFKSVIEHTEDYYSTGKFYDKIEKKLVRKEFYQFADKGDYKNSKTSLEIRPLPPGFYTAEFSLKDSTDSDSNKNFFFTVSDYKVIYEHKDNNNFPTAFKLVDSENGSPIPNEEITLFEYVRSDEDLVQLHTKTDAKGIFEIPSDSHDKYYRKYIIQQPKTNDFQMMAIYGNQSKEDTHDDNSDKTAAQIFTDRAVYRPGQTVYFKVINSRMESENESVVSGIKQKIILSDANIQEISSQEFTTNEFGSYHGRFVLPKGKLNGIFALIIKGETEYCHYFRVEEYKRPTFEITFEPVKGEYQYGQSLELRGKAVMFSGVPLNEITVHYEIEKDSILWKFFSHYSDQYKYEDSVLGKVETNHKGEFTIPITFQEDPDIKGIQVEQFDIKASVTDINGETQSASVSINVASASHYIKAEEIKDTLNEDPITLKVETKNYNDQNISKSYHVKLSKLKSPNRIFRSSFQSEIQNSPQLTKEEFTAMFPYDYFDESEFNKNTEIEKVVLDTTRHPSDDPSKSDPDLDLGKLEIGRYRLDLYDMQHQDHLKTSQFFNVWDKNSIQNEKTFLSVIDPEKEYFRGEEAKIYVYSAIPNAVVTIFIQDRLGHTVSEMREFQNGVLEYSIKIPTDKNVSAVDLQFQIAAYNDVQHRKIKLNIKSEDVLTVETKTFRDKIQPGSKEKWSVKVSGKDNEHIVAEVLAAMYDRSLDHFEVHTFEWQRLHIPDYSVVSYDLKHGINAKLAVKRVPYVQRFSAEQPYFNWYDGDLPSHISRMAGGYTQEAGVLNELGAPKTHRKMASRADNEKERGVSSNGHHEEKPDQIFIRQNLKETAFFYPDLQTDSEGNVSFEFTSPEALTAWKLLFLAHTKDVRVAILEKEVVTQKEFSVTPNYPRFLREGDELNFQSKISNLTNKKLSGSANLQILDAFTNEDISSQFGLHSGDQNFDVQENGNSALTWNIRIPDHISSIILKTVAKAGPYCDGEQKSVPVLPNRMLVTDAVPIFVKEGDTKTFELENLKNTTSTTISNVSNTLELTTNPIWEIMFALPGLKYDQNNSADVIFNKWFADVVASEVFKANPKIKTVFEEYQHTGLPNSNLEKNQELKNLLLDETPWLLESKNETEQMAKLALLFDVHHMQNTIQSDWDDFKKLQNPDGGFSWHPGYPSSYGTSLYILKNLGKINSWLKDDMKDEHSTEQNELIEKLIEYADREINKYSDINKENVWNNWTLDYLYTRNYWEKQFPLKEKGAVLKSLVKEHAGETKLTDFTFFGLHRAALLMNAYGLKNVSDQLLTYLKETSADSKTQGVYWKQNLDNWGWFGSKVVNHAGAIEAFNTLKPHDEKFIEDMKIWLITQKEVNSWGSSRGTSEVIFTILNSGKSWTTGESDQATIVWGGKELQPHTQAAGYVKSTVKTYVSDKNLATVTITKSGAGIVQGGLFWQYYEDLDKIISSESNLSITKELYKKVKTVTGEELQKITPETPLKVGDKVTVRMILNTDRPMEFIHIKDMRAAGFEPLNVLSGYQWKHNLGYYQSTKDASTNFYIEKMPKGKYVFEYDYTANASGKFSNGITTLQNYYAPQMNVHTKGDRVEINSYIPIIK